MLLVELIFEAAESSLALNGPCPPASGPFIGNRLGEVRHVLVTQHDHAMAALRYTWRTRINLLLDHKPGL